MSALPIAQSTHFREVPDQSGSDQFQAKRSACDRCRGQKLRCPREDKNGNFNPGKCRRCSAAGAVCSFSALRRAGRPPASSNTNGIERNANENDTEVCQGPSKTRRPNTRQRGDVDTIAGDQQGERQVLQQLEESRSYEDNEIEPGVNGQDLTHPIPFPSLYETAWGAFPDLAWGRDGESMALEGNGLIQQDPFRNSNWPPFPLSPSHKSAQNRGVSSGNNASSEDYKIPDHRNPNPTRQISGQHLMTQYEDVMDMRDDRSVNMNNTNLNPATSDLTEPRTFAESLESPEETQHRRMQELSELGMRLYSQIKHASKRHSTQTNPSSLEIRVQDISNILKSSTTFLSLLKSFHPPPSPPQPTASIPTSESSLSPSTSSLFSDLSDFSPSHSRHHKSRKRSSTAASSISTTAYSSNTSTYAPLPSASSGWEDSTKSLPTDTATIFQLLTCYLRFIDLHSLFYTQIHDYLTQTLTHNNPSLPLPTLNIFPSLQIGEVSLADFQKFQVKLVVQISAHMLGEMEMALGLPDGYRISRRKPTPTHPPTPRGILESSVSVEFVEMAMREEKGPARGAPRDRFASVREVLRRLKVLLRGTINI